MVSRKQFRFRFENSWLKEPSFKEEVVRWWKQIPVMNIIPKHILMAKCMSKWGRQFFHKFGEKVKQQKEILSALINREDDIGVANYFEERDKLNELCYMKMSIENNEQNYCGFKRGTLTQANEGIDKAVFEAVFLADYNVVKPTLNGEEKVISESQNDMLTVDIKFEEFTEALKHMHPDKTSGPDGYSPAFFQQFWDLVGQEVFQCCKSWLSECMFPAELNNTNLVLIPKEENVENLTDVRPIALYNVVYKLITKVLVNRLKRVLPVAISVTNPHLSQEGALQTMC
ncbi:uncharacterized protein LOC141714959 [Apium graveolens]|uniref:uncharacterized protein LOC141714959 n=1 Tax=Apium graveolens TaxID=4045 RepID=UPI003D79B1CD